MSAPIELTRVGQVSARFLTEDPPRPPSPQELPDIFSFSPSRNETTLSTIHPEWRRNLYALLEQPTSSDSAFLVHVLMTALIVLSAIVTVLETVPAFHSIKTSVWFGLETSLVKHVLPSKRFTNPVLGCAVYNRVHCSMFSLERYMDESAAMGSLYVCALACEALLDASVAFFGIIDLLSVAPYYIELLLLQDTVRRPLTWCRFAD